ncbi:MAG: trehalose-6-phosphate synthase [Deltaproteobacteria bacterium]|nr:MAG: trehalose-6-phosphate synthase [Deltaproteobacteria bacterium]
MPAPQRLLVVSHRAPVEVSRTPEGTRVTRVLGGLTDALNPMMEERGGAWIAWAAPFTDDVLTPAATGLSYPIHAVRLREPEVSSFNAGFANQVLWPLCHMFPTRCRFQPTYWTAYRQANERFAAAVRAVAEPGSLVWVNDFHLCLVPGLLRSGGVPVRMGLFWHVPFPPPSLFGICPWRAELLGGLLGAELIGFQTALDVRNFLDCVQHFLGLPVAHDPACVQFPEREVRVVALPVGIDAGRLRAQAADPAIRTHARQLREASAAEVVLLGVDRLDYTKGIPERLLGFERFLERHPDWRRRVSLVQITVPSPFRVPESREMKRTLDETVGRIIGRFSFEGRSPLLYIYTAFDHERLAAYYVAADVALVTPLRDGMNLVAKEYVACHADGDADGALILSEFAGAAADLREAFLVNPYDPDAIQRQISVALALPPDERRRRMRALAAKVSERDVYWWASSFLRVLADAA